ncbi:elongin-A-like [Liolophura sinensis]|uniref:elongin-A-like n=1 Tax=Liolophura sinensis TaxID=3198878 RepID=UPI003158BA58
MRICLSSDGFALADASEVYYWTDLSSDEFALVDASEVYYLTGLSSDGFAPADVSEVYYQTGLSSDEFALADASEQFLGETDELWVILCNRDFRGAKPDEMESWRELYLRRYDEREAKLQKLKANIAASEEARKAPVRLTKLAYVDTVAKPPRDVRRKQMKYGTATVDMSPSGSKPNPAGYQRSSLKSRLAMDTAPVAPRRVMKAPAPMMQENNENDQKATKALEFTCHQQGRFICLSVGQEQKAILAI